MSTVRASIVREVLVRLAALPKVVKVATDGDDVTAVAEGVAPDAWALEVYFESGESVPPEVTHLLPTRLDVSVLGHFSRTLPAGKTAQDVASELCAAVYGTYQNDPRWVTTPAAGGGDVPHAVDTVVEEFGEDVYALDGTLATLHRFTVHYRMRRDGPGVPA